MNKLLLIELTPHRHKVMARILDEVVYEVYEEGVSLQNRKILFVVTLDSLGYDIPMIQWLKKQKDDAFKGSYGSMIVISDSDYYTKSMAQDLILHTNRKGLGFIGHGVLEMTKNFKNFETWQKTVSKPLRAIAVDQGKVLIQRLEAFKLVNKTKVVALHASSYKTSNTLNLWKLVKEQLINLEVKEIHIENGTIVDCKGCPFQTCIHYGEYRSCFYGGSIVEEVLPAIESADVVVWICPNYNDSVSANILAAINRLTVLYRQMSFHNKACYAVVVSGNSGSDSVAKQLIGALNINKGFQLPPYFSIMATANDPLKVLEIQGIEKKSRTMANRMLNFCKTD